MSSKDQKISEMEQSTQAAIKAAGLDGWTGWEGNGGSYDVVGGHVNTATFNAERDKHVSADPVEASELVHGWAITMPDPTPDDPANERIQFVDRTIPGAVPVTWCHD